MFLSISRKGGTIGDFSQYGTIFPIYPGCGIGRIVANLGTLVGSVFRILEHNIDVSACFGINREITIFL
jgi:hypothetical protein